MSEELQGSSGGGISYADVVPDTAAPGLGLPGIVDVPTTGLKMPERVDFGIDGLGQWCIEVRAKDGTLLLGTEDIGDGDDLDLATFPVDSPAGAVALQEVLKQRFKFADIVWRPGVMNSIDEQRSLAQRALAAAGTDREAAREATENAEKSLREALPLARAAGIGPGEMARRTGYARSTITKALNSLASAPVPDTGVPGPAAPQE
ncbi:hypothetical protein [Streptomyces antibioticus]|uniref:hypothetical protein n=1 Tax=Streptomyces antibioticus TaxID=1890 RepID=UPI0033E64AA0